MIRIPTTAQFAPPARTSTWISPALAAAVADESGRAAAGRGNRLALVGVRDGERPAGDSPRAPEVRERSRSTRTRRSTASCQVW